MKPRFVAAALALTLTSAVVLASPASAGEINPVVVSGSATCDVDAYQLDWTIQNNDGTNGVIITSALQSGAWEGPVAPAPNPIPAGGSASASDGPVPGDTVGTVSLTVGWQVDIVTAVVTGTSLGTIDLAGDCVPDEPTTTTTTEERAETVTRPAFTG
jgi:hypothetical protein